jgi:hypothetical protein
MTFTGLLIPPWKPEEIGVGLVRGDRPVQISLQPSGTSLDGQMLSINSTQAEIVPYGSCFLFSKVKAQARFLFGDTLYTLTGSAVSREASRTILLDFDEVTRTNMARGRNPGSSAGAAESAAPREKTPRASKRTKTEQKTVLYLPPPDGTERRIESRYSLESPAALYIPNEGEMMQASLLELSRSGCRLFSETPFALRADTRVEVQFSGNGFPHRICALVRPKPDEHVTGLEFVDMAPRRRVLLNELVGELEETSAALR